MITEKQREERLNYIGSSDAAAILGISRWKTALEVWAEKTQNIVAEDISEKLPVKLGNKLEQTVAELFTEETGLKVRRVNETLYHPKYPFVAANLDRRIVGTNAILEAKTCSAWKAKEWDGEDIPKEYICQVMHQLAVSGHQRAYLAVLIGNQAFKVKIVERDDQIINDMIKREVHFWNTYIVPKVMPMTITSGDSSVLYDLFPMEETGSEIELGDILDRLVESRSSLLSDKKNIESILEKTDNEIKALLGDNESAKSLKHKVSWKSQTQTRLDTKLIQAEAPEIYEKYSKNISMRVLRIRSIRE